MSPSSESAASAPGAETDQGNGILEGSVVDDGFVPIQAATVKLLGSDRQVETSWNGNFRFTNLEPGLYRLEVQAVGWSLALVEGRVTADRATRITIFLDPVAVLEEYHTLQQVNGQLTCADAEVPGQQSVACELQYHKTSFPGEWVGVLIEVDWGPSGVSSSSLAQLTAEDRQAEKLYADLVAERPGRMLLYPGTLHDGMGGTDVTPAAGEFAPLDIGIKKDPARAASTVGAAATFQQEFDMYITTFYNVLPDDIEDYTALPE